MRAAEIDWQPLIERALEQRRRAYAPYSEYHVGAALLTADGRVFAGSNVENRTYGLTICAERVAMTGREVAFVAIDDQIGKELFE